jgi:hypothetical protein
VAWRLTTAGGRPGGLLLTALPFQPLARQLRLQPLHSTRERNGVAGSALLKLQHVYSAALLFFLSVVLLVASLVRFFQEASIGLTEADHYR